MHNGDRRFNRENDLVRKSVHPPSETISGRYRKKTQVTHEHHRHFQPNQNSLNQNEVPGGEGHGDLNSCD